MNILPAAVTSLMKSSSSWLMLVAMAGIGMRIKISELLKEGPKALLAGTILTLIQVAVAVILIKAAF